MSELLKELRERHALAVHVRNDINASIASLTTELAAANFQIWDLESACRALEGASAIAGAIVAPDAAEIADDPVSLTEAPSQAQEIASALDALDAEMWARSQKHSLAAYANAGGEYWPAQYAKKREMMGEKTEVTGSDPYNPTNEEIHAAALQVAEEVRPVFEALAAQRETASQAAPDPLVAAVAEVNETVEGIAKANGGGWNNYWSSQSIAAIETNS